MGVALAMGSQYPNQCWPVFIKIPLHNIKRKCIICIWYHLWSSFCQRDNVNSLVPGDGTMVKGVTWTSVDLQWGRVAFFSQGQLVNKTWLCPPMEAFSTILAPVPLSIFRSNSKFDENSERSSFKYIRPITTIFCTRHDSDTVVTCAKYRCDRPRIFYTRVFWIFIEFRIRSKYA